MLAEFGSVVDAMRCALDVQRGMVERNRGVSDEKRIEFRIGINVGDIIIDRDDIFGRPAWRDWRSQAAFVSPMTRIDRFRVSSMLLSRM